MITAATVDASPEPLGSASVAHLKGSPRMSWFSKHVISPVRDFFKGPDLSGITNSLNQQAAAVTQQAAESAAAAKAQAEASARALELQKTAMANASAAATPVIDSESARSAGEERMRKLLAANGGNAGTGIALTGMPPVGYRMLTGQ